MDPVRVVQALVDAVNARDLDRTVACFSANAVLQDDAGNAFAQGREAIRTLYAQIFAHSPDAHADIRSRIHVGPWVVDEEQASGFVLEGFPPNFHAVFIYRVEDDKIVKSIGLF
jgi:hypothetical protein